MKFSCWLWNGSLYLLSFRIEHEWCVWIRWRVCVVGGVRTLQVLLVLVADQSVVPLQAVQTRYASQRLLFLCKIPVYISV